MRCQGARIVPGHPVYIMLVPRVECWPCVKTPEVYASVRSAARVCANDAQSRAWLACGGHTCYVVCRGTTRASPCFASYEGVAPAVLPILLFHNRWKPTLACPGQPWTVITGNLTTESFCWTRRYKHSQDWGDMNAGPGTIKLKNSQDWGDMKLASTPSKYCMTYPNLGP